MSNTQKWAIALVFSFFCGLVAFAGIVSGAEQVAPQVNSAIEYPGEKPGKARDTIRNERITLENNVLAYSWTFNDKMMRPEVFVFKSDNVRLDLSKSELFTLALESSPMPQLKMVQASELKLESAPSISTLTANDKAIRLAERFSGKEIQARFTCPKSGLNVVWKASLRDGSNYVRQEVKISSNSSPLVLHDVMLLDMICPGASESAIFAGSPVTSDTMFFGVEHPASDNRVADGRVRCSYPCGLAVHKERQAHYTCVSGVFPRDQKRRGFLYYIERERACPFRAFLNHNNGSLIGRIYYSHTKEEDKPAFRAEQYKIWGNTIEKFCSELIARRSVPFDSFVHDYGWDDEKLVWQFHSGYPKGFEPWFKLIEKHNTHFGIWFSPWGGYSAHKIRLEHGNKQGLELHMVREQGRMQSYLTLAGPRYYDRFFDSCLGMLLHQKVNYFKFDGFGVGITFPGEKEGIDAVRSDIEGVWRVMSDLRKYDSSIFINPSTGTWPSPFWLLQADSIWRGGYDTGYVGDTGSKRQQWITFRDADVFKRIHSRAPFYPISSLMIHGIEVNKGGRIVTFDEQDIDDEIRAFFATGVNLQELYVKPELLTERHWDTLAECAKWARANAQTLADVHWIGGDPAKVEVYGRAAWTPEKAILTLRNPSDKSASIMIDAQKVFELPTGANKIYVMKSPLQWDASRPAIPLSAGNPREFKLKPFEVVILESLPPVKPTGN